MIDNEGTSDIYFLQKSDAAAQPVSPIIPEMIKEKLAALSDEIKALSWDNLDGSEADVKRRKELIEEIETDLVGVWHRRLFPSLPDWTIEVW